MSAVKQPKTRHPLTVRVECHSGYRGEETPRRIHLADKTDDVARVLDQWLSPEHRYFKCLGSEGDTYILRHDVQGDRWEISFYQRGQPSAD